MNHSGGGPVSAYRRHSSAGIRRKGPAAGTHRPDAEIWWPSIAASPYAGQVWAIEIELTASIPAVNDPTLLDELPTPPAC